MNVVVWHFIDLSWNIKPFSELRTGYVNQKTTRFVGGLDFLPPTGSKTSPRYYEHPFSVTRVERDSQPRQVAPMRRSLIERAKTLRQEGLSYPEIADILKVSVSTAWNWVNLRLI